MSDILQPLLDAIRQIVREEVQQAPIIEEERWITTEELMAYLGVSRSWISHRIREIPHINGPQRFKKSEVDAWLREKAAEEEGRDQIAATRELKIRKTEKKGGFKVV